MVRFDDLLVFVTAADNGSLTSAARHLDVSPAVASAALKRLETELNARLLARSTRSLQLTPDGTRYLKYARNAIAEIEAGRYALAHGRQGIGGNVSISLPSDLGRNAFLEWTNEFQAKHPRVNFQFRFSDSISDMFKEPVDVALRYGRPDDSTLIVLPLVSDNRRVVCSSPEYFKRFGRPRDPHELARHNCLRFALSESVHSRWIFHREGAATAVVVSGDRVSDDAEVVHRWALQGHGVAYKSRLDVLQDLRAGRLEQVLQDYDGEVAPLSLVCTHRLILSPTINALRDFLVERIKRYHEAIR